MPPNPIILAFDTAAAHCAAVLVQGGETLAVQVEDMSKGQAERLFPLIEEVLEKAGIAWSDLSAIAVGTGPGNFTGIRISVSAARGLALSLGIPAIGISRLEAMAFDSTGTQTAIIDARQNRIYTQAFENGTEVSDIAIIDQSTYPADQPTLCDAPIDLPATMINTQTCLENAAQIAAIRTGTDLPKPAPLYVRAPDAALPSDPPPTILP